MRQFTARTLRCSLCIYLLTISFSAVKIAACKRVHCGAILRLCSIAFFIIYVFAFLPARLSDYRRRRLCTVKLTNKSMERFFYAIIIFIIIIVALDRNTYKCERTSTLYTICVLYIL